MTIRTPRREIVLRAFGLLALALAVVLSTADMSVRSGGVDNGCSRSAWDAARVVGGDRLERACAAEGHQFVMWAGLAGVIGLTSLLAAAILLVRRRRDDHAAVRRNLRRGRLRQV